MSGNIKAEEKLAQLAEVARVDGQEKFKELSEIVAPFLAEVLKQKIAAFVEEIGRSLAPIIERVVERVRVIVDHYLSIINQYPNKRVLHLAKHGKGRVRKKNINRIREWVERLPATA